VRRTALVVEFLRLGAKSRWKAGSGQDGGMKYGEMLFGRNLRMQKD